ncbi:MAG: hypothetical protein Q8O74_09600 [bacterium]|nr:hypothetical protein [bacterium]
MLVAVAGIASAATSYIKIHYDGAKYVVHPASEVIYQASVAINETGVWYYSTEKDVNDFAQANVFGAYDTLAAAESAIVALDPGASKVYRPPVNPA